MILIYFVYWCFVFYCFFFFKQKTAYEMRISDWSSDVCSSDLLLHMSEMAMLMKVGNSGLPCFPKRVARKNIGERFGLCCLAANIQSVAALRRREDEMPPFIIPLLGGNIHVTDNFGLATAVTVDWSRAKDVDAGRGRRVPN